MPWSPSTPYYWKVTEANLRGYFGQIADAVSIPVLIYNFPDLTGQNLTPEFIKSLVDVHPNIVGVKDTIDSVWPPARHDPRDQGRPTRTSPSSAATTITW